MYQTREEKYVHTVILVFGSQLQNNEMNRLLLSRLDTLLKHIQNLDLRRTSIVVSGGLGRYGSPTISEADLMYAYLISHGIPKSILIKEEESTSTLENILFTQELWRDCNLIALSSDFHLPRIRCILDDIGCSSCKFIGASTDFDLMPFFAFEETLGIIAYKLGIH